MDINRFETLEAHVVSLVEAFARVQEENEQLRQDVKQLRDTLYTQQKELERLQPEQEELTQLRVVMQTLQREREVIRQKLQQMLRTIEWLEGYPHADDGTKTRDGEELS
jgi:predicted  nucleic acid-binding Zn-ribbon protein